MTRTSLGSTFIIICSLKKVPLRFEGGSMRKTRKQMQPVGMADTATTHERLGYSERDAHGNCKGL